MKTYKGFFVKKHKKIGDLELVLKNYLKNLEKYNKAMWASDQVFWHNEIANVSVLAGAAWQSKFVAMAEFSHDKVITPADRRRKEINYTGRGDLYLCSTEKDREFYIEAKQSWVSFTGRSQTWEGSFQAKLSEACNDVQKVATDNGSVTAGVLFASLFMPEKSQGDLEFSLEDMTKWLETRPYDAAVWYFPKEARKSFNEYEKRFYPGMVMIMETVK